jgi:hypothetical protein
MEGITLGVITGDFISVVVVVDVFVEGTVEIEDELL